MPHPIPRINYLKVDLKSSIGMFSKFLVDQISYNRPCAEHYANIIKATPMILIEINKFLDILISYPQGINHRWYLSKPKVFYSLANSLFVHVIILLSVKNHYCFPDPIKVVFNVLFDIISRKCIHDSHQHWFN